jgi:hydrogenase maturation protease
LTQTTAAPTAVLIGLGNPLRRDDGVGVVAVRLFRERYLPHPDLAVVDGGTLGFGLLAYFEAAARLLCVDAVDFGEPPGHIGVLEGEAIPAFFATRPLSLHQAGLPEVLALARLQGCLPRELRLIGMQPQTVAPGLGLSPPVQDRLDLLLARIVAVVQDWGAVLTPVP